MIIFYSNVCLYKNFIDSTVKLENNGKNKIVPLLCDSTEIIP